MSPSQDLIYLFALGLQYCFAYRHSHTLKILTPNFLMKFYNQDFLMSTTRKEKKARKSRGAEMLSDIENLDIMLRGNQLEREESEYDNSSR